MTRIPPVANLFAIATLFLSVHAHTLEITSGLSDYQVVQVNENGTVTLDLSGTAKESGSLEVRVVGVQRVVQDWVRLGEATPEWSATLPGVPVGGPYRVELRIVNDGETVGEFDVHQVLAGDVWVLAGQSNMQGVGNRTEVESPDPRVYTFSMSYEWRVAQEPLHTLAESPDSVHFDPAKGLEEREKQIAGWRDGSKGAGLGLAFAKEMVRRTGRPVGLIASAHGGTSMAQWDPALRDQGGASLYGSMCQQVAAAGGKVRGVLWYQGESDANGEASAVFPEKLAALIAAMRRDFNNPELPFLQVQIGRVVLPWDVDAWNRIQVAQLDAASTIPDTGVVASVDLGLDDGIHIGTPGLKVLGMRLANLAERALYSGEVLRGPRVSGVTRGSNAFGRFIRVSLSDVNGRLVRSGRLSGFSISEGPLGQSKPYVYNVEIAQDAPNTVIVWVNELPEDAHLWYGRGLDPYCNLLDEAGMALPVTGPIPIP